MYRTIDARFWTDPKVRELSPKDKLLFLYFITSPHAHFSGLYYVPKTTISHETGLKNSEVDSGIDTLSIGYLVRIDTVSELIWVVNMFRYQSHSKTLLKNIETYLKELHNSPLIGAFLEHYSDLAIPYRYPIDTLSYKEQEQRKEQIEDHEDSNGKETTLEDTSEDFEKFWKHFIAMKRNVGKPLAERAWNTTLKGRPGKDGHKPVDPYTLIEAAKHYRMKCEMDGTEPKYIKQPATFLGPNRHWEDFKEVPKPSGNGRGSGPIAPEYQKIQDRLDMAHDPSIYDRARDAQKLRMQGGVE